MSNQPPKASGIKWLTFFRWLIAAVIVPIVIAVIGSASREIYVFIRSEIVTPTVTPVITAVFTAFPGNTAIVPMPTNTPEIRTDIPLPTYTPTSVSASTLEPTATAILATNTPVPLDKPTEPTNPGLQACSVIPGDGKPHSLSSGTFVIGDVTINGRKQYDEGIEGEGTIVFFETEGVVTTLYDAGCYRGRIELLDEIVQQQFKTGCTSGCAKVRIVTVQSNGEQSVEYRSSSINTPVLITTSTPELVSNSTDAPTPLSEICLAPVEVVSWCEGGLCKSERFEQLQESNGVINPCGVKLKAGGSIAFNIPAKIVVDVWNCFHDSQVTGPIRLSQVCEASFRRFHSTDTIVLTATNTANLTPLPSTSAECTPPTALIPLWENTEPPWARGLWGSPNMPKFITDLGVIDTNNPNYDKFQIWIDPCYAKTTPRYGYSDGGRFWPQQSGIKTIAPPIPLGGTEATILNIPAKTGLWSLGPRN